MRSGWWPRIDPGEYRAAGDAARARARELASIRADAARVLSGLGAAAPSWARVRGVLVRAEETELARAGLADALAELTADTRDRLDAVAAAAARDAHDLTATEAPGDPLLDLRRDLVDQRADAVAAEVAEDAETRAGELARRHDADLGGGSGAAPLAGMGGVAAALDRVHRPHHYAPDRAAAEPGLAARLRELCAGVTGPARGWVRLAVARVVDGVGRSGVVVGTSELDGYLRPGVALRDGELVAGNEEWPELSIAAFCAAHGLAGASVVGAYPLPEDVAGYLRAQGFDPSAAPGAWSDAVEDDGDAPDQ
ncbi:hypothetical protein [Tsukamurella soli]|uniref:hypothetical protein n=1 Tax=Tsukamurella soli TaxID=644556 RepID=UPI003618C01A